MLTTLVFDIGRVLLHWDVDLLYARLIPDIAARRLFLAEVLPPSWNLEQDRGRSWSEAEDERIALFPQHEDLIRAFRRYWHETIPGAIDENVRVLEAGLSAGIPSYAITNFAADTFAEASERFGFLKRFHGRIVSGEEGLLKPDPAIYALFLSRFGKRAEECLFMDDSRANIDAAAALGFATIHVTPETNLLAEVRRQGFMI
ncbi:COG1011 Predicted hydrolase (HAD superfamily) [Rhabdaerophilaceae bacterium]